MKFLLFKVATAFFFKQDVFRNRPNLENSVDSDMHISKSQVTKITAAGTEVEYNVYFHTHFPRYKLRTLAKKSELCDTVEQVIIS